MRSKFVGDLLNFFRQIVSSQKTINSLKKNILNIPGFNIKSLFLLLSQAESVITIKNIQTFLEGKVACNERQLYDIFQRLDHHRCGVITIEDFNQEMSTHDFSKKKKTAKKTAKKTNGSETGEPQFRGLLSFIIRTCRVLDTWRNQLQVVNPYIIFEELNRSKTGVISKRQLFHFFYQNSEQLSQEDAQILYKSLLRRHYKQVNLQVFCENLKPLEFNYYPAFKFYLEQDIQNLLILKQKIARQAVEAQQNYLKERRNQELNKMVHHEAALNRQRQLELRIQDQLKAYRELKYLTKKKNHPHLTFDEFIYREKENQGVNVLELQKHEDQEVLKSVAYLEKMRNIDTLREIQLFQANKIGTFHYPKDLTAPKEPLSKKNQQQLEKRIRNHTYSVRNVDDLVTKRHVARNLQSAIAMG